MKQNKWWIKSPSHFQFGLAKIYEPDDEMRPIISINFLGFEPLNTILYFIDGFCWVVKALFQNIIGVEVDWEQVS
jgi:hypothetical protein